MSKINILVLHETCDAVLFRQHTGIRRYATTRDWNVVTLRVGVDSEEVSDVVCRLKPAGIIISLVRPVDRTKFASIPVVFFDCPEDVVEEGLPYIYHDAEFTAHLVASELFSLKCECYAFAASRECPTGEIPYWSRIREYFFEKEVRYRKGRLVDAYYSPPRIGRKSTGSSVGMMKRWLSLLPKPCGIFAANDKVAAEVCASAQGLSLRIPDDVAVVGIDDSRICTLRRPTITSVVPDWEGGGYMAAATLGDLIDGRRIKREWTFRPIGLKRRETTTRTSVHINPRIVQAMDIIRARACAGLRVDKVVAAMRTSRRFAEENFRDVTGSSILEEIRRVRFDKAKFLLSRTQFPLTEIMRKCGYRSLPTFCREFKRLSGLPPETWRKKETIT